MSDTGIEGAAGFTFLRLFYFFSLFTLYQKYAATQIMAYQAGSYAYFAFHGLETSWLL